jgi:uncharacterized repeat protein (TIGR01451 family)
MLALLLGVSVVAQAQTADDLMYGIDNISLEVYVIDQTTGDGGTALGTLSFSSAGVARHPTSGLLYYAAINPYQTGRYRVATFNLTNGANTNLTGFATVYLPRLAFRADGVLYGMDTNNNLYTVNTTTGNLSAATAITCTGSCGGWGIGNGGDMAFAPDGTLYVIGSNALFRISGTTAIRIGSTGTGTIAGVAFGDDGQLYASDTGGATSLIYRISTADGSSTVVGNSGEWLSDLASLPKFANLSITKTATGSFVAGTNATYTLNVTNNGPQNSSGPVTVTDTLPAGLTFFSGSAGWTCSALGQNVTCTRATGLNNGVSSSITLTVTLAANVSATVVNSASVSCPTFDSSLANNTDSETTTITFPPDLTINKSHTGNFTQGQIGNYSIVVTNSGLGPTTSAITVSDTLPAGLSYSSFTGAGGGWGCGIVGQVVTCTNSSTVNAGASYATLGINVLVAANAPFSVTNTASVSGGGETTTNNNSDSDPTTINGVPDLTIAKSHTGNFTQGQINAPYTITVTNSGTGPTSGTVTVTDTLPAGLAYASFGGAAGGWGCSAVLQVVTCTNSNVIAASNSYAALTLNVNVSPTAPASVTNTASVSGGGETNAANNSASNPTTINQLADLTVAKTHTGNFTRGSIGTYNITVTNSGAAQTSASVTVTDTLPAGLTPTGWSGAAGGWSCIIASQTVTCTNTNTLNAGVSYALLTITVGVAQNAAASVTNTATVSGGGQVNTANDTSSDPTTIVSSSDLSLTKITNNSGSGIGTNATFTVTLTNSGPTDATGITVRDQLPAGLTYISSTASAGAYNSATGVWTLASVLSGASPTLQIVARIDVIGSITNTAQVTASDQPDPDSTPNNNNAAEDDQASSSLTTSPPNVVLCKTIQGQPCPPVAQINLPPGSDITYVISFTNTGGSLAQNIIITDPSLPPVSTLKLKDYTYFKIGSVLTTLPAGMSLTDVKYSDNNGVSWTYSPSSGAGGAPAGYDGNVTHLQLFLGGQLTPGSSGNASFTVRIR